MNSTSTSSQNASYPTGLTTAEAQKRHQQGLGNNLQLSTSRSYIDIVRSNVWNAINVILFSIGIVMISIDRASDAITSVGLITLNIIIGIYQESRAKRQLDQIALLTRPKVTLVRDNQETVYDLSEIVKGDTIKIIAGDQMVVDGVVIKASKMELDESLLTGESDLVQKIEGDEILSGSFCVAGTGYYEATKIGEESFANRLTASAREFQMKVTPLQNEINFILRLLMLLALFLGTLMLISTIISQTPFMRQVQFAAVIAGLVPNGLFLMVIVAYAMGAVRIARQGALVQQSNAVENLSRVTVLCTDKTGTLTANRIVYDSIDPFEKSVSELEELLKIVVGSQSSTNKTSEAIINALGKNELPISDEVPFSSRLKWSAVAFEHSDLHGVYVIGALESLEPYIDTLPDSAHSKIEALSAEGKRVVVFAYAPQSVSLHDAKGKPKLPPLKLLGLIAFTDELRPHLKETLSSFIDNGIQLKVISGDSPHTVTALAKQAGFPGELTFVSGVELAKMTDAEFAQAAVSNTVFGRITPDQKKSLVEALQADGQYVAMMGDGVNDVLSLKKADMSIAMESGSNATRSVADMILLDDSFKALPLAFTEGQRIINGMKDILRLFLTRVLYSAFLIIGIGFIDLGFPFEPKHNDLLIILGVGIPTLALAVWARPGPLPKGSMLRTISHFVLPASFTIYAFGLFIYILTIFLTTRNIDLRVDITAEIVESFRTYAGITYDISADDQFIQEVAVLAAQSALTTFLVYSGLLLIVFVEPPIQWFVGGDEFSGDWRPTILAIASLLVFWLILIVPPLRSFFEILRLPIFIHFGIIIITLIWMFVLRIIWRNNLLERFMGINPQS
jgi:cation-transporting P-type ATPase E